MRGNIQLNNEINSYCLELKLLLGDEKKYTSENLFRHLKRFHNSSFIQGGLHCSPTWTLPKLAEESARQGGETGGALWQGARYGAWYGAWYRAWYG